MPTKPIDDLICRELASSLEKTLGQFAATLEEAINFGSHVFNWCVNSIEKGDQYLPVFMSFRHILELMDGISELIKRSCAEPCKILLRSIFESLLSVEYILENNTEQRGKDFLIWHRHRLLEVYHRHDPRDNSYVKFTGIISEDKLLKHMKPLEVPDIEQQITELEKLFKHPGYIESEKEFQRIEKVRKSAKWYSMHNGPNNIYELAIHLKRPGQYETIYRLLSGAAHGQDIIRGKVTRGEKGTDFTQIRIPSDAQFITTMTIGFALDLFQLNINHFIKEKLMDFRNWYLKEMHQSFTESFAECPAACRGDECMPLRGGYKGDRKVPLIRIGPCSGLCYK